MNSLVWLREDLRLSDNPALHYAASLGELTPVYIFPEGLGGASYWWLHHSLSRLQQQFLDAGVRLILRTGSPEKTLITLANELNSDLIIWNRVYSPEGIKQGSNIKQACDAAGLDSRSFNGQLLIEPTKVLTKQSTPFKVFTPFWRNCLANIETKEPLSTPSMLATTHSVASEQLSEWDLLPSKPDWSKSFTPCWQPGESGAQQRLQLFLDRVIENYAEGRDIPSEENTSLLSPHLAFGEISAMQIWHATQQSIVSMQIDSVNGNKFLSEIGWREFSRYLLVHFPKTLKESFNPKFDHFPWQSDATLLKAWQTGQTGYPIVDAGMRELWATGYMHNRVRMITASFLCKHCLTHWHEGMSWFWDTLVDADIANNTASWQWVAGSGADASPYFRIFNPILQGEKFDKDGVYIKKWVPELEKLDKKYINKPWEADRSTLKNAGIILGQDYPAPIVDHKQARQLALEAYAAIRSHGT